MSETFKGLKINNFETISAEQWKQLNRKAFVFIEDKSDLKPKREVKKSRKKRKKVVHCYSSKRRARVGKPSKELYWAQSIVDSRLNFEFELLFLVKWEGYDENQNTWQSVRDLFDCNHLFRDFYNSLFTNQVIEYSAQDLKQLKDYLKDLKESVSVLDSKTTDHWLQALKRAHYMCEWYQRILCQEVARELGIESKFGDLFKFFEYCDKRNSFSVRLNEWVEDINSQIKNEPKIAVENRIDYEIPPKMKYLSEQKIDKHMKFEANIPSVQCDCEDDCRRQKCLCALKLYHDKRRFQTSHVVYECNSKCLCSLKCENRRIQRGRTNALTVFRTETRGWGLKTREKIEYKEFIGEYIGQVLDSKNTRGRDPTYFFSIDREFCGKTLFVDGKYFGNITRFANHSCQPNMDVHLAWVDGTDRMPRIGFFANRTIKADEELTYDYKRNLLSYKQDGQYVRDDNSDSGLGSDDSDISIKCLCANDNCKQFI